MTQEHESSQEFENKDVSTNSDQTENPSADATSPIKTENEEVLEPSENEEVSTQTEEASPEIPIENEATENQESSVLSETSEVEVADEAKENTEKTSEETKTKEAETEDADTEDEESEKDTEETETDDEEEEDELEVPVFAEMNKNELVAYLDTLLKKGKLNKIAPLVKEAKNRFNELFNQEKQAAKEAFLAIEGNAEMDFEFQPDLVDRQFRELYRGFAMERKAVREAKIQEKENNLAKKKALIEQLKALVDDAGSPDAFGLLRAIQDEWRSTGAVPIADANNLYETYRFYNDKFNQARSLNRELSLLDQKKNLEHKKEIIASIHKLTELSSLKEMMHQLKSLQESWNDAGMVPKENMDEIMTEYRAANQAITERKDELVAVLDTERQVNLQNKQAIIEAILNLTDDEQNKTWVERNKILSKLIVDWKKIGATPKEENERIRAEFREAVKVFNHLKNVYFKEQKREKLQNYKLKVTCCEEVEKLLTEENPDLKKNKNEIIRLQKYWKTIGPTSRKESDEVWKRFRTACDEFFNKLKNEGQAEVSEQVENLEAKKAICEKIEALATLDDANNDTLKMFEEEFRQIGFVPFKEKNKIDLRFKNAVKEVLKKTVLLPDVPAELEDYRVKIEGLLRQNDPKGALDKELTFLNRIIEKQEEELNTLETNINFFAKSKGAEKMIGEVKAKIELIKNDVVLTKKKIKLVKKSYQFTR